MEAERGVKKPHKRRGHECKQLLAYGRAIEYGKIGPEHREHLLGSSNTKISRGLQSAIRV